MRWPTSPRTISNPFGRITPDYFHHGVDFPGEGMGTPLVACLDFSLYQAPYWSDAGGWSVGLRFSDGVVGYYQHARAKSHLTGGGNEGALVGYVGSTGKQTTGPHLHFATYRQTHNGLEEFDPVPWLLQGTGAGDGSSPFPSPDDPDPTPLYTQRRDNAMSSSVFGYKRPGADQRTFYVIMDFEGGLWDEDVSDDPTYGSQIARAFGTGTAALTSLSQRNRLLVKFKKLWPNQTVEQER